MSGFCTFAIGLSHENMKTKLQPIASVHKIHSIGNSTLLELDQSANHKSNVKLLKLTNTQNDMNSIEIIWKIRNGCF